jgi:hypothetical protein
MTRTQEERNAGVRRAGDLALASGRWTQAMRDDLERELVAQEQRVTLSDRSSAPDSEFAAHLAHWEAEELAPESIVERVARAIWECHSGAVAWDELNPRTPTRAEYRRYAVAAIEALRP